MSFSINFLDGFKIELPQLSEQEKEKFRACNLELEKYHLDYQRYSVFQNPFRGFPYYSASNIHGGLFLKLERKDNWTKDDRIPLEHQHGKELYDADYSNFDKGHLTKREDVQWGISELEAKEAANSTFFYTNAVPQVAKLNRSIWRSIENYILHHEGRKNKLKLSVFTGPVLNDNNPIFVTVLNGKKIQLPRIFWKVVYYLSQNNELYRTAFLTNQSNLLRKKKIVIPLTEIMRSPVGKDDFFLDFKDADTYQTDISVIESLTSLSFSKAKDVYTDNRIIRLIIEDVDIRVSQVFKISELNIKNLKL